MHTRCPHCTASFRVSKSQLQAAQGKVRCGACMEVFDASVHLLQDDATFDHSNPVAHSSDHSSNRKDKHSGVSGSPHLDQGQKKKEDQQMLGFGELDDLSDTFINLSGSFEPLHPDEASNQSLDKSTSQTQRQKEPGWREKIHLDLVALEEEAPTAPVKEPPQPYEDLNVSAIPKTAPQPVPVKNHRPQKIDNGFTYLRADPADSSPSLAAFESNTGVAKWVKITVLASVIVLITTLCLWLGFDKLARYHGLRPLYDGACQWLGCQLPTAYDISQIHHQNLTIRTHPLISNALIVDTEIINKAPIAQPYPDITLTLADQAPPIRHTFAPDEYLPGHSDQKDTMPVNEPIHIALKILSPSIPSPEYQLAFVENEAYKIAN